ncbi:lactate dehydrogenase/glycoside hydrolase [Tribonema minus]|uniref:L-lactate dehydrogenase n=1 Tax=Tribonema minus TaxID=303371 RepID=A0A835YX72_9STRA|nr:lactate dehydrogenase/glycoside hydrolase [Tribonema minus]
MSKISIVGVGSVGASCAMALVSQRRCSELVLYDVNANLCAGEALDLQQAHPFHGVNVKAATAWEDTSASDIVVITAGARQRPGESRLELNERNTEIMRSIVPDVVRYSHHAVIIVVSNPCDIMAQIVAKMAFLPPGRVFGSGTYLDSSRFRSFAADRLNVDAAHIHAVICGEHGDSSVLLESTAMCGGTLLSSMLSSQELKEMHERVISSASSIISLKGFTASAIGITISRLAEKILRDSHSVVPVSTAVKGLFGIEQDVFLSVPCVIGRLGVERVLPIQMSDDELAKLRESAARIASVQ